MKLILVILSILTLYNTYSVYKIRQFNEQLIRVGIEPQPQPQRVLYVVPN